MGSHPRTSSCATISSRAHLTVSHAWQRLSSLLSSGLRPPYRHNHISYVEGGANRSLSIYLSQTQLPVHLTALVRLLEQSCPHPICLPPILRHHYRTHVFPLHEVPASTTHSHQLAFPRCGLKVQIRLRPAMWGRHLERILPRERRVTATKCHQLLHPVRLCVHARLSATLSSRGP